MTTLQGDYLELRPLPESDIARLWKVYQGTPLYFDALGCDVNTLTSADVSAQWQAAQATAGRTLFGVYHIVVGLLIGAVEVQLDQPVPGAAAIWLLIWGGFQRQGYGQECVALIEGWLAEAHSRTLSHAIAADNAEGLSFLELQGFVATRQPATSPVAHGAVFWMQRPV